MDSYNKNGEWEIMETNVSCFKWNINKVLRVIWECIMLFYEFSLILFIILCYRLSEKSSFMNAALQSVFQTLFSLWLWGEDTLSTSWMSYCQGMTKINDSKSNKKNIVSHIFVFYLQYTDFSTPS